MIVLENICQWWRVARSCAALSKLRVEGSVTMDRYQDEMGPATALLFLDKARGDVPLIALELCSQRGRPLGPGLLCNQRGLISDTLRVSTVCSDFKDGRQYS